jgi:hypothetical protein
LCTNESKLEDGTMITSALVREVLHHEHTRTHAAGDGHDHPAYGAVSA